MASKRKMEITVVDENERVLFSTFQNVANHLCQLYAQASANQKQAFEAGQHYSYVKMHEWIAAKLEEGKLLTLPDILGYLQDKMSVPTMRHTEQWGCGTDQNCASASHGELTTPFSSAQQSISSQDMPVEMNSDVTMD
ncbi:uncharacterized protein LOC142530053 isoform X2 [Primulina tabacum]|uniref:uncharacterized protein LOC142529171 isoform X2 n=1 Tax=Primulina tabacum TaxID=48773 RepID=UPI003F5A62FC